MADTVEMYGLKWVLGERGDDYILRENNYRVIFDPDNGCLLWHDVWLDIGSHFGSFAVRAAPHVKRVIAVEPAPENYERLEANVRLNNLDNVLTVGAAVVGGDDGMVELGLGKTFDYTHKVGHTRGREHIQVYGRNINSIVEQFNVTKIKMDCEGSEEEIMEAIDYGPIQEIILEWHFTLIPDPTWEKMEVAIAKLEENGFRMLRRPIGPPTKRWTAILWAQKL